MLVRVGHINPRRMTDTLQYMTGFGGHFESEAVPGALPKGRNSPAAAGLWPLCRAALGQRLHLRPRTRTGDRWLYRMRPTADHRPFTAYDGAKLFARLRHGRPLAPNRLRWDPPTDLPAGADFVDGLVTMLSTAYARGPRRRGGPSLSREQVDGAARVRRRRWRAADHAPAGRIEIQTELGRLEVAPGSIGVVPRGMKFRVDAARRRGARLCRGKSRRALPPSGPRPDRLERPRQSARLRNSGRMVRGPRRADRGDPEIASAHLWTTTLDHSPLDVVAWHGNYAPCRYDLSRFNTIGTVSFDHPDPSIFTVLTSPSNVPGRANADFVIFPPRWMVGRGHVPPALVPPQRDERGDGPDLTAPMTPRPRASRRAASASTI